MVTSLGLRAIASASFPKKVLQSPKLPELEIVSTQQHSSSKSERSHVFRMWNITEATMVKS
ncbi:hypothetical protein ACE1AT_17660 [Pelatocladus sp. BLCC-F211]|uniref:hypothetical protein n=1 Tax=Pelatocladus sp. BLCC-F211 TaxID=3342752 RepID=UPI0035B6E886